uniref:Ribosomal protein S0 n=1 Tax=Amorphochlora amoebiformis TaxID=1561963 RepID=A0A0H5BLX9_9EUKA|nr:ribosomal protein S0 [Amorphochlora amoebiformis]
MKIPKKILSLLLYSQANIGQLYCYYRMKRYVYYKIRNNVNLLNLLFTYKKMIFLLIMMKNIDQIKKVLVIETNGYANKAVKKFCSLTKTTGFLRNYKAGNFSNRKIQSYFSPSFALVTEPNNDKKIVFELSSLNIPISAVCNSGTSTSYVDIVIPYNTASKFSVSVFYYILSRVYNIVTQAKSVTKHANFIDYIKKSKSRKAIKKSNILRRRDSNPSLTGESRTS